MTELLFTYYLKINVYTERYIPMIKQYTLVDNDGSMVVHLGGYAM